MPRQVRLAVRAALPALVAGLVLAGAAVPQAAGATTTGAVRAPATAATAGATGSAAVTGPTVPGFTPLAPTRLLDTRIGLGAPAGPLGAGQVLDLQATGRGGVPASGVAAVLLNLTATAGTTGGYLATYPTGAVRPTVSSLNFTARTTVANLVVATLGTGGKVRIFNALGSTHVVADVTGWMPTGAQYTGLTPARLLDTRDGTGAPAGALGAGRTLDLQVTGRGGVPAGAVAVALNVTGTRPTAATAVSAYPTGSTRSAAAELNLAAQQTAAVMVLAKLGTGGKVTLFNATGSVHLVADVSGWYSAAGQFVPTAPYRLADTRTGVGVRLGKVGAGGVVTITGAKPGGASMAGEVAAVLAVTAVKPTESTYLTVYPGGTALPGASSLNPPAGSVVSNTVVVKLSAGGAFSVFNKLGQTDVVVDVLGWMAPSMTITSPAVPAGNVGVAYRVQLASTGGEGTARTWSLAAGSVPPGLSLSASGLLSGTPTAVGRFPMTFQVVDETGAAATQDQALVINL